MRFFLQKQGDILNFTHTTSIHTGDVDAWKTQK